jgi:putative transcriptional regulator
MRLLSIAAAVLLSESAVHTAAAQSMQPDDLAAGKMLVASRDLPDPNFSKTVILLVQYDDEGVVGLILNRRSKVPISRVLEDVGGAKERSDPIYAGGPVGRTDAGAGQT